MTELYFRISCDYKFLIDVHEEMIKTETDDVIKDMIAMMEDMYEEGIKQEYAMIWQRADYMTHGKPTVDGEEQDFELKQVEVNNGAAGGFMADHVTEVHRRLLSKAGLDSSPEVLPKNETLDTVAEGIILAWELFGDPKAVVVIMESSTGILTQFVDLEIGEHVYKLSNGRVKTLYMNYLQCSKRMTITDDRSLILDGNVKVAVVYYRVSLLRARSQNPPVAWEMRRMIERSTAIKCPTIGMLLASTKKVQQVLAMPGMVEKFFPDEEDAGKVVAIRETFADLWGLENDDAETKAAIKDAIEHPERYVMKANKDGGGFTYWNEQISEKLQTFTKAQLAEYILMQKFQPPKSKNYIIRALQEPEYGEVVNEISTFGYAIGNFVEKKVIYNKAGGYLMRTKWAHVNEGGILIGTGVYDTPYLTV